PGALDDGIVRRGAIPLPGGVKRAGQHLMDLGAREIESGPVEPAMQRTAQHRNRFRWSSEGEQALSHFVVDARVAVRRRNHRRAEFTYGSIVVCSVGAEA